MLAAGRAVLILILLLFFLAILPFLALSSPGFGHRIWGVGFGVHRGTSLTRKRTPLKPYRKPISRVAEGS